MSIYICLISLGLPVLVALVSLGLLVLSTLFSFQLFNKENNPAAQLPRWSFFVAAVACVASGSYVAVTMLITMIFDKNSGFLYYAPAIVASAWFLSALINATHKSCFIKLKGNEFGAATDIFFGKSGANGIRIYRIFFGGLKAKFPWEVLEIVDDLNKDTLIKWGFVAEFSDATGKVTGVASLRPNSEQLQQYLTISTKSDERKVILTDIFNSLIEMLLGDSLKGMKIADAMADKKGLCAKVKKDGSKEIKKLQKNCGVLENSFIIGNIDYTDEVRNAAEQEAVNDRLGKVASKYLKQLGYSDAQIKGEDKANPILIEHLKWATDMAKETAGEIKRTITDVRGLEGLGKAAGLITQRLGIGGK